MFGLEDLSIDTLTEVNLWGTWVYWLIGIYFCLPILGYVVLPFLTHRNQTGGRRSIAIFVLGDLGHSPRMCYHARSFAGLDYQVNLCGYLESELAPDLLDHPGIDIHSIPIIKNSRNLPFILFASQKIVLQIYYLFDLLFEFRGTKYIMIQNPPSMPLLLVVIVFIKLFSNSELIIDWHNLNYSILNLRYNNQRHPIVRLLKLYEKWLGRFADLNLTVTKSMKQFLVDEFGLNSKSIKVLYDRPGDQFSPLERLEYSKDEIKSHEIFKHVKNLEEYKILISSTSFTPDEDFNVLLNALKLYDDDAESTQKLLMIVTGKGPLKNPFLRTVEDLKFSSKVVVQSVWLLIEDYPLIISVADIAISLHTSSSGLDLPMKILDFFGCGVPVISLNFPSIGELVKHGKNGLITNSQDKQGEPEELYRLLKLILSDPALMRTIGEGAMEESELRWRANWNHTVGEIFRYN
ncbi:mannosyltransferase [Yamadazyma tenuis]|uniref:Chitobiosyldiphosphodolichol beta-mannosyltransferase n=1 Tax=Candida tenuis (strain ATCC 10573 / BCRC 21748 / CBS 615 / JCM 9827 / NBRC 10315 / NRRL Y-1498 / VKM Y-70) TaxID=590646 RepID=G3AY01_CANTC|nr:uncharacterized protein CANTEDRAFT_101732 [Yamadazyma tenuis ATCC 10573]EGV65737.1 hypothetical protein CANTEDRAFT_101732 [Yamadazyma tenuis ATCC 10573]WEJ95946.1 mannosyltransferase [Yamadazyma tenuis]